MAWRPAQRCSVLARLRRRCPHFKLLADKDWRGGGVDCPRLLLSGGLSCSSELCSSLPASATLPTLHSPFALCALTLCSHLPNPKRLLSLFLFLQENQAQSLSTCLSHSSCCGTGIRVSSVVPLGAGYPPDRDRYRPRRVTWPSFYSKHYRCGGWWVTEELGGEGFLVLSGEESACSGGWFPSLMPKTRVPGGNGLHMPAALGLLARESPRSTAWEKASHGDPAQIKTITQTHR